MYKNPTPEQAKRVREYRTKWQAAWRRDNPKKHREQRLNWQSTIIRRVDAVRRGARSVRPLEENRKGYCKACGIDLHGRKSKYCIDHSWEQARRGQP